jgi:hypothetical protein
MDLILAVFSTPEMKEDKYREMELSCIKKRKGSQPPTAKMKVDEVTEEIIPLDASSTPKRRELTEAELAKLASNLNSDQENAMVESIPSRFVTG